MRLIGTCKKSLVSFPGSEAVALFDVGSEKGGFGRNLGVATKRSQGSMVSRTVEICWAFPKQL